ncbi:MAG: Rpn family recombination-promoting nuclease/putative transposase [Polyangiaceae bacterium]|nr:Rpn family recombination-promoting nuclease/putative transposase [Polyangiaceae bacterium]
MASTKRPASETPSETSSETPSETPSEGASSEESERGETKATDPHDKVFREAMSSPRDAAALLRAALPAALAAELDLIDDGRLPPGPATEWDHAAVGAVGERWASTFLSDATVGEEAADGGFDVVELEPELLCERLQPDGPLTVHGDPDQVGKRLDAILLGQSVELLRRRAAE